MNQIPLFEEKDPCGDIRVWGNLVTGTCILPKNHPMLHKDSSGTRWAKI